MASILDELQTLAYDSSVSVADLLRRVKVAATKLALPGTIAWVGSELNGYTDSVPDYRYVPQRLVYLNIFSGWQPIMAADANLDFISGPRPVAQPICEIEELAGTQEFFLFRNVDPELHRQLNKWGAPGEIRSQFSRTSLISILDVVRTRCLDWALDLEKAGIHGHGISFSAQEKELAQQHTATINFNGPVGNIAGPIGTSTGPTSINAHQQYSANVTTTDARDLALSLRDGAKSSPESQDLVNQVADDIEEATKSTPPDLGRLHQALRMARTIVPKLISWTGRVAAEAEITRLLGG